MDDPGELRGGVRTPDLVLGILPVITVDNGSFHATNPCGLYRVGRTPCGEGACYLLERDMTENNYGPKGKWAVGSHRSTVIVSQRTLLPIERDELWRYPDGKTRASHATYFDWGIPNVIEAPIATQCKRVNVGFATTESPGCEPTPSSVR